jgi:hypothetical protein
MLHALALLLLLPFSALAVETKSVADMTAAELEAYLGKGKQSQFAGLIKQARDYKAPSSDAKARELYTRLTTLKPVDKVEVSALTEALGDPEACWDILCSQLCQSGKCGEVCRSAVTALRRGEPPPKDVSAIALEMIKTEREQPQCRFALMDGLALIGPSASSSTVVLSSFLDDPALRCRAAATLGKIQPALGKAERADCAPRAADASRPDAAKAILLSAVRCKLAEKKMTGAKKADYKVAYSSGKKLCDAFTADYGLYLGRFGDGAYPYLWSYCGEKYKPDLCAPLRSWIETHK